MATLSRKIHKWLSLVLGIQLFIWALSGFYMVAVDIDIIHGDMLVTNMQRDISAEFTKVMPLQPLLQRYPTALNITLKSLAETPVYLVDRGFGEAVLLDANSGVQISPLDRQAAIAVAQYHYAGGGAVSRVELLQDAAPAEMQFFPLPLWRIDFDDAWGSSFYVQPSTGRLVSRRHTLWRVFDFLWMLHIMDYDERDNVNNILLRVFSGVGVVFGLSGLWLLFTRFRKNTTETPVL